MHAANRSSRDTPLRLLFVCTGNSARSQIGEAILTRKGAGRIEVGSAGSQPAARIHPLTVDVLRVRHRLERPRAERLRRGDGPTRGPDHHRV